MNPPVCTPWPCEEEFALLDAVPGLRTLTGQMPSYLAQCTNFYVFLEPNKKLSTGDKDTTVPEVSFSQFLSACKEAHQWTQADL